MLSSPWSSHGSKSAGHLQEQPLRMPDNSLAWGEDRAEDCKGREMTEKQREGTGIYYPF